jgi:HK97 family phage portal protein
MFGIRTREERAVQATAWGEWGTDGGSTWSGAPVSTMSSLQLLTVYGCVRFIADGIATLPVDTFRKLPDGTREPVTPPSWLDNPAPGLDRVAWFGQLLTSLLLDGNAYLYLDASSGRLNLYPLDPTKVAIMSSGGRVQYVFDGRPVDASLVEHIKGIMWPGSLKGLSPVEAARQSIGVGMSAQEYAARFFGQGATMSGVIESPADMPPGATEEMAKAWARKHSGKSKSHLPGVLTGGAKWVSTSVTNEQAQFLETRQFTAAEIAAQMFQIDPSELGIGVNGTSLTYANLEQRATRRVQVTYLPWIIRLENAVSNILARPRYMKFNTNAVLRGDTKTRYETYSIGITNGILGADEAREFEDLPPRDDLAPAAPPAPEEGEPDADDL